MYEHLVVSFPKIREFTTELYCSNDIPVYRDDKETIGTAYNNLSKRKEIFHDSRSNVF